jgi:hypothetical protein
MFKNIVKLSAFTAVILFSGCGGTNGSTAQKDTTIDKGTSNVPKELKSLVKDSRSASSGMDKIESIMDSIDFQQPIGSVDCPNGGSISYDINQTQTSIIMKMKNQDCNIAPITINGETLTTIVDDNMTISFATDLNISEPTKSFIIKQGSSMFSIDLDDNKSLNIDNIEILSGEQSYKSENFKYMEKELSDGKISSYNLSGKEIVDGKTFIVDSSYDGSITPLLTDKDENLISGKTLYTNDQNHSIVVEVIEGNKLKLSIDEDRDGVIDKEEIIDQ